ncbi:hypothetical protein BJ138DRAFT_973967, partial [Hygrophoropsis aurantiaca]
MPFQYFKKWSRSNLHADHDVSCLAFSTDGFYLASSIMDGTRTMNKFETISLKLHDYPIDHIAFDRSGTWLATSARQEIKIWKYLNCVCALKVYASFFHTGFYRCWDPKTGEVRWTIPLRTLCGHSDLSPDETCIVVSNQVDGADIYRIPSAILLWSIKYAVRQD